MTTANTEKKPTAKEILVAKIVNHEDSSYKTETCLKMSMRELKEAWTELNEVAPEIDEAGGLVIPEQPLKPTPPAKEKGTRGPSKRDALYEAFDSAHAAGSDLKVAAREAAPGTSEGVISSYLCYWRKDRSIASTRSFGNSAVKLSNGEKALKALIKVYGEEFDFHAAMEEIRAAIAAEYVAKTAVEDEEKAAE